MNKVFALLKLEREQMDWGQYATWHPYPPKAEALRRVNPEAAHLAVLEYLELCQPNIAATARAFGITRPVVYDSVKRHREGDLADRSRASKRYPHKTPDHIEDMVVVAKNKTRWGPKRLAIYLQKYEGLQVPDGAIRHILRHNRHRLAYLEVARVIVEATHVFLSTGIQPNHLRSFG